MIGDKIVDLASSAGSTVGYYMGQCGQILDQASGQAFSNPGKLYTDLSTGTLDALNNKVAATALTAGVILAPAILGVVLAVKGVNLKNKANFLKNGYHREDTTAQVSLLNRQKNIRYVAAVCSFITSAAVLYMTATELRQSGSMLANQL